MTGILSLYDGSNVIATATLPGNTHGTFQVTLTFNGSSAPLSLGTHSVVLEYPGDSTWPAATSNPVPLDVVVAAFTASVNPTSLTVTRGASAASSVTVVSSVDMILPVNLSCTGLPAEAGCSFSSNPVMAGTVGSPSQLTITTTAAHSASLLRPKHPGFHPWQELGATGLVCVVLLGIPARRRGRSVVGLMLLAVLLAGIGCGGSGVITNGGGGTTDPGTPAGTYTVVVTGSSGFGASMVSHSVNITLTVQ
jgi:hypothetical protein